MKIMSKFYILFHTKEVLYKKEWEQSNETGHIVIAHLFLWSDKENYSTSSFSSYLWKNFIVTTLLLNINYLLVKLSDLLAHEQ